MKKINVSVCLLLILLMLATPAFAARYNAPILSSSAHTHQMSSEWVYDVNEHWHRCQTAYCGYVEDKALHDFDGSCDAACNTCGYVRFDVSHSYDQQWQSNEDGHWRVCLECNQKSSVSPHTPGPEATETTPQKCTQCNYVIQMPLGHTHSYGNVWYKDNEKHWQCCTDANCGKISSQEPHRWGKGTPLESGGIRYFCSVCNSFIITDEEMESTAQDQQTEKWLGIPEKTWVWIGIIAIAGVLLLGIAIMVTAVIVNSVRKKQKQKSE